MPDGRLRRADDAELLRGLVAIPSLSGAERDAVVYLCAQMESRGFDVKIDEAGNAVGSIGSGAREIVLLGHIDTVPGEIAVRVDGETLYGRGAVDAKGPLATFICAATRAATASLRVTVIGAVGEEADSVGAHFVAPRYRPDFCVIGEPGGWESAVLGYKGSMSSSITLERPGGHSAGPRATAPQLAVDFWRRIQDYADAANVGRTRAFDTLDPTLRAIASTSDGLHDRVEMRAGFRLPLDRDGHTVAREVGQLATDSGEGFTIECSEPLAAFRTSKNSALVRALLGSIRERGGQPRYKVKTGTADMNIVGPLWGCPIVAYGPGDSALDHTPEERIDLDEYARAIDVLAGTIAALGGADGWAGVGA